MIQKMAGHNTVTFIPLALNFNYFSFPVFTDLVELATLKRSTAQ